MGALIDLLKSERGLFALALVIASTLLAALGPMTVDMWKDFNLYVFGIYAGGKTITSAVSMFTSAAPAVVSPLPTATSKRK